MTGVLVLLVVLLLIATALSALYSGSETGVYAVNRLRLELRSEEVGDRKARLLQRLLSSHELVLCVLLLGNNIANEMTAIVADSLVSRWWSGESSVYVTTLLLTPLLFICGEALPKQLFRQHAETWTYAVAPFLWFSRIVFAPLTWLVLPVARVANRWASGRRSALVRHDEYALDRLIVEGGSRLEELRDVALSVGLGQRRPVRELIVPFDEAKWIDRKAGVEGLRQLLRDAPFTRYPVREDDGRFLRYVHFLDPFERGGKEQELESVDRPIVVLDADCQLDQALVELERVRSRVAVVRRGSTVLGFLFAGDLVAALLSI